MHHDIFGQLVYMNSLQRWVGSVVLPQFARFGEWGIDTRNAAVTERRRQNQVRLTIEDPNGAGPAPPQEAAFRHVQEKEAQVLQVVLAKLFETYQEYRSSRQHEGWFSQWLSRLSGVQPLTPIASPEALGAQASFCELEVSRAHKNGLAYLVFAVHCAWEPEHGIAVIYHKDVPAAWGNLSDLPDVESDESAFDVDD